MQVKNFIMIKYNRNFEMTYYWYEIFFPNISINFYLLPFTHTWPLNLGLIRTVLDLFTQRFVMAPSELLFRTLEWLFHSSDLYLLWFWIQILSEIKIKWSVHLQIYIEIWIFVLTTRSTVIIFSKFYFTPRFIGFN